MIDSISFIWGMFVCALLDVFLSMASYFLEKAIAVRTERKQNKKMLDGDEKNEK